MRDSNFNYQIPEFVAATLQLGVGDGSVLSDEKALAVRSITYKQ
jgi:hypothetical protein